MGTLLVPVIGTPTTAFGALTPIATGDKKKLADLVLNTARGKGASYVDVRIGRYLNQFLFTREDRVQNIVNTESYGAGVRVTRQWHLGLRGHLDAERRTADRQACRRSRRSPSPRPTPSSRPSRFSWRRLKGVGERFGATPIEKNAFEVPISEKVDLLMERECRGHEERRELRHARSLFLVNEQKYFASTDGSYIDQDVHRIWPTFTVTGTDAEDGQVQDTHRAQRADGHGLGVPRRPQGRARSPGVTTRYATALRHDRGRGPRRASRSRR